MVTSPPDCTLKQIARLSCYNSHIQVLKTALAKNHFPLLVLEDDAMMNEEQNLNTLMSLLPSDKMIYFGALPVKDRKKYTGIIDHDVYLYGAHAYGFKNKDAVIFILQNLHNPPIDSAYVAIRKKYPDMFGWLSRWIFIQDSGFSDIEQRVRKWS
jgi:GR25 family glycosyltransferase involved in LPS biosynthesis